MPLLDTWVLNPVTAFVRTTDGRPVASVYGDSEDCVVDESCLARARLVVAAPDLLGIVTEMLRSAEDLTWNSDREWFVEKARAILAKVSP